MHSDPVALRALDGLVAGSASVEDLAVRMSAEGTVVDAEELAAALRWASANGQVQVEQVPGATAYSLTPAGLHLAGLRQELAAARDPRGRVDLDAATALMVRQQHDLHQEQWTRAAESQSEIPASDLWRDWAINALSDAYAAGRLTMEEHDQRCSAALAAPTMGALRGALGQVARLPLVPGVPLPPALRSVSAAVPAAGARADWVGRLPWLIGGGIVLALVLGKGPFLFLAMAAMTAAVYLLSRKQDSQTTTATDTEDETDLALVLTRGELLHRLEKGGATLPELVARCRVSAEGVRRAMTSANQDGVVLQFDLPSGSWYTLSPHGLRAAALNATVSRTRGQGDDAVLRVLTAQHMTERRTATDEVRADNLDTLAGDQARDLAIQAVSEAFAAGRIPAAERERRASLALRARTFGELAEATHGLTRTGPA